VDESVDDRERFLARRVLVMTSAFGARRMSVADLFQLQREVSHRAGLERRDDPQWRSIREWGLQAAGLRERV
jgi:hypothetical protein